MMRTLYTVREKTLMWTPFFPAQCTHVQRALLGLTRLPQVDVIPMITQWLLRS
jgi:hypothetical protein